MCYYIAIKETKVTTIWYKLYVRVGLDGLHLSSGNFAILYYNGTTYNWIVDDHESGEWFARGDVVYMRESTIEYVTAYWCDKVMADEAMLIMHNDGYTLNECDRRRIKEIMEVT